MSASSQQQQQATDHDTLIKLETLMTVVQADVTELKNTQKEIAETLKQLVSRSEVDDIKKKQDKLSHRFAAAVGGGSVLMFLVELIGHFLFH